MIHLAARVRVLRAFLAMGLGACGGPPAPSSVPSRVPDAVPPDLYHDSVMVDDASGRWSRAVLALSFSPDVPVEDRTRAVQSVGGEVIGGWPILDGGYYLIRVAHGATLDSVDAAIVRLKLIPGVWSAIRVSAPEPLGPSQP